MAFKIVCKQCDGRGKVYVIKGFGFQRKCRRCNGKRTILEKRISDTIFHKDLRF